MSLSSLTTLTEQQLDRARTTENGRSAHTVHGGPDRRLRQTVMALVAGRSLAEHASPGDATLQVLRGRVRLIADDQSWTGAAGDLLAIPDTRHSLHADEDSVVLLTVALG